MLGGEQAQSVAHENGDTGGAVKRPVRCVNSPLKAAGGHGVGGESQVGLSLATAGGEEEEFEGGHVAAGAAGAAFQSWFGQGADLHENEGELEDAPVVRKPAS